MKKSLKLLLLGLFTMLTWSSFATDNLSETKEQECDEFAYFQVLEADNSQIVVRVYENSAVDDFCNFLKRKDIAASVGLWCVFMPGNPVCTVYGVAMAACSVYGAVQLTIKGDFSNAIIETISASTKVYKMSKIDTKNYKIE